MKIVINRSGAPLKIPELQKEIPWNGKRYLMDDSLADKYHGFLEIINEDAEIQINNVKREIANSKTQILKITRERDSLLTVLNSVVGNSSSPKIDFLYSFHFNEERKEAIERLRCSIKSIRNQNVRICICDTSEKSMKMKLVGLGKIDYYHHPLDLEVYNKPMTINLGVRELIKSEYFFLSDVDLYYNPDFVKHMSLFWVNAKEPVRVVFHNHNMGQDNLPNSIVDCHKILENSSDSLRSKIGIAPGNGLIHRKSFDMIGGFDERYIGYGPEDGDFNYRIQKICKYSEINLEGLNTYHMFHCNKTRDSIQTGNNMDLYEYMLELDGEKKFKIIKSGQIEVPKKLLKIDNENIREVMI